MKFKNKKRQINFFILLIIIIFLINPNYNIKGNPNEPSSKINKLKSYILKKINNLKKQDYSLINDYKNDIFFSKPLSKINTETGDIVIVYNYNEKGQLIDKKYILDNQFFKYKYNNKDILIYKTATHNSNFINTYEYNDKNQIVAVRNNKNKIQTKYEYNVAGQRIQKTVFLFEQNFIKKNIFTYDYNSENQKIRKTHYGCIYPNENQFIQYINSFLNLKLDHFYKIDKIEKKYLYNKKGQKIQKIDHLGNRYNYKYCECTEL